MGSFSVPHQEHSATFQELSLCNRPRICFSTKHGHLRVTYSGATPSVPVFLGGWTQFMTPILYYFVPHLVRVDGHKHVQELDVLGLRRVVCFPSSRPLDAHAFCCADAAVFVGIVRALGSAPARDLF